MYRTIKEQIALLQRDGVNSKKLVRENLEVICNPAPLSELGYKYIENKDIGNYFSNYQEQKQFYIKKDYVIVATPRNAVKLTWEEINAILKERENV